MAEEIVTITVRDFIENIRKNGLPKTQVFFFRTKDDGTAADHVGYFKDSNKKIGSACAMGQGFINSNMNPLGSPNESEDPVLWRLYVYVYEANDNTDWSFAEIADRALNFFAQDLDETFSRPYFDYTPYIDPEVLTRVG